MSNLTINAGDVYPVDPSACLFLDGIAGATIAAGETAYLDSATNTYKLADSNGAPALSVVKGIAMQSVVANQPIKLCYGGIINIGAGTPGTPYYQSATAGKVCPHGDLTTNDRVVRIGDCVAANRLNVSIFNTQVTL